MMRTQSFRDLLYGSAAETGSIVCMGIDPVVEALPYPELSPRRRVLLFFKQIFEEMRAKKIYPGAFKPNIGFFHALDRPFEQNFEGSEALRDIMQLLRDSFPSIPVILDMKRGDIARSSRNYAEEAFLGWQADAVTISPYMGADSVAPFLQLAAQVQGGVYVLNRTSNPGARDLQNLILADGRPLYRHVAEQIISWSAKGATRIDGAPQATGSTEADGAPQATGTIGATGATGAVVGATNLMELQELAQFYAAHEAPLLIPGVGGQGGSAAETLAVLSKSNYPLALARINSSSGLTHPWLKAGLPVPEDWVGIVVKNLEKLNGDLPYEK